MTAEQAGARGTPVTLVISGESADLMVRGPGGWLVPGLYVRYGPNSEFAMVVPIGVPGVEIRREEAPPADPELVRQALGDAITFYVNGCASIGCPSCDRAPANMRCSAHDRNGPTVAAYRDALARLDGAA